MQLWGYYATIDAIKLNKEIVTWVDEAGWGVTYVWRYSVWDNPIDPSGSWWRIEQIFVTWTETRILKPVDPATGVPFRESQVWNDRASYTYN